MFGRVNNFFAFAALLSTGVGVFASPFSDGTQIFAHNSGLCLAVSDRSLNSHVEFGECSDIFNDFRWEFDPANGNTQIQSVLTEFCAGIGDGDFITLQDCDSTSTDLQWNFVTDNSDPDEPITVIGNSGPNELCLKKDSDNHAIATACANTDKAQFFDIDE